MGPARERVRTSRVHVTIAHQLIQAIARPGLTWFGSAPSGPDTAPD